MEVKLNDVSYMYNLGTKLECPVFNQISVTFNNSKINVIIGKSGSGKTTLLELLSGLILPSKGEIQIISKKNNLQPYLLFKNPSNQFLRRTVRRELELSISHFDRYKRLKEISSVLKKVGLDDSYLDKNPLNLSHSERYKIMLASLLISDSSIVLLDEPTIGLDTQNKQQLIRIIRSLKRKNKMVIIASNDIEFIYKIADYVYVLNSGKIILEGNKYEVFTNSKFYKKFQVPKIVEFTSKVQAKGVKLDYRDDTKDLMKDVYRHVTK